MTSSVKTEAKASAPVHETRPIRDNLGFEFRTLLPVFVYAGLFIGLTLLLVWLPLQRQIAADPSPILRALFAAQLFRIEVWLVPLFLLSGTLAAIVALLHARRVARSVQRLREGLTRLSVSDPEPLTLQRRDEFHELEAPFAGAVNRMQQLIRGNLEVLRFLRHNLEGLSQRAGKQRLSDAELQESIAVLMRDVDTEIKKLQMRS